MAKKNEPSQMHVGYYVVACIDILGQKDELDRIRSLASLPQSRDELEKLTLKCCKRLKDVREAFKKGCEIRRTNPQPGVSLSDEQQRQLDAINTFAPPQFQGFGDTVIAYSRVKNDDGKLTIGAVDAFLGGCAMTLLICLAEGLPIRGAIDVELGFDCFDGEIYGPAVQSVHMLESEIAGYPRIVVGDGLFDYLKQPAFVASNSNLADNYNEALAKFCKTIITRDLDGALIVDYAGTDVRNRLCAWTDLRENLHKALEFGRRAYEGFVRTGNRKLALRYALLANCLKSRDG